MVARKDYIQYIWFGIQFLYLQGELILKVIETTEGEIQTLLKPYYSGDEKKEKLAQIEKNQPGGKPPQNMGIMAEQKELPKQADEKG